MSFVELKTKLEVKKQLHSDLQMYLLLISVHTFSYVTQIEQTLAVYHREKMLEINKTILDL